MGEVRSIRLGDWQAPDGSIKTGQNIYEAQFDRPALSDGETGLLLFNALGTHQTVTLNGKIIYGDAPPEQARTEILVGAATLRDKGNVLRIEATRYEDWGKRDSLQQLWPATLAIMKPAPPWRRSTFNGVAQVIVQSESQPGTIVLEATAAGLVSAAIQITAR